MASPPPTTLLSARRMNSRAGGHRATCWSRWRRQRMNVTSSMSTANQLELTWLRGSAPGCHRVSECPHRISVPACRQFEHPSATGRNQSTNSLERRLPDFRRPTPPRRSVSRPDAPWMAGQRRTRPRELRRRPAHHVDRRGTSTHRRRGRHADRPQLSASQCGDPAPRIRRDLVPDQRWPEKPRLRGPGDH